MVSGTIFLCTLCAAVIHRRTGRENIDHEAAVVAEAAPEGLLLRARELIVPFAAMAAALTIVWGSVHVLPRKAPDAFSSISLDGTWALTARAVPANPSRDVEVTYRIDNKTPRTQEYAVSASIVDGPEWSATTVTIEAGASWVGTVSGRIMADSCRSRLEIDMMVVGDPEDHFPLAVFFRDSTLEC